jgi:hypothetical protein
MAKSDLFCSLEGSSWTDPVTNWTLLAGVKLDVTLANILKRGQLPPMSYPAFVHECTHHWSFHTEVGVALAMLQLNARRKAMLMKKTSATFSDLEAISEAQTRYETTIALLKPLAEGLALFAEFDAFPGKMPSLSLPSGWVMALYGEPTKDEIADENLIPALERHLLRWRTSMELARRKANLMIQPLRCVETNTVRGYLPGYLLLKQLQIVAIIRDAAFLDADFFYSYTKHFFFNDFAFVDAILDSGESDVGAAEHIAVYFQQRLSAFAHSFTKENVARVAKELNAPLSHQRFLPDLKPGTAADARGQKRLLDLMEELRTKADDKLESALRKVDMWTIAQRELMCLGSFSATLRRKGSGLINISRDGNPIAWFPALPDAGEFDGEGTVAYFFSPSRRYRAMAASFGTRVVSLTFLEDQDDSIRNEVVGYILNRDFAESADAALRDRVQEMLADSVQANVRNIIGQLTRDILDRIYIPQSLNVTDEKLPIVAAAMSEDGFLPLLDGDLELLTSVALVSTAASLVPRSLLAKIMKSYGRDLEDALRRAELASEKWGIPFFNVDKETIVSLL